MTQNVLRPRITPRSATALLTSGSLLALGGGAGALGAVLLASPAAAATFTVTEASASSLGQAIFDANASPGADTIEFAPGVTGIIDLPVSLPDITDSLTIIGPGSAALTISGNTLYHAFTIATGGSGGVTISGLTIDGSDTRYTGESGGGAIAVTDTALTLDDVTLTNNRARPTSGEASTEAFGGGLGVNNAPGTGDVVITNSVMTNNVAEGTPGSSPDDGPSQGGGAWITADNITITNSTFSENQAELGAGLFAIARESLTLTSLTVSNNTATELGGGLVAAGSNVAVSDSVVSGNQSLEGFVGGAYLGSFGGTFSVTNTRISDNTSARVGGAYIVGYTEDFRPSLDRVTVTGNVATDPPDPSILYSSVGGLLLFGSAEVSNSTISDNTGTGVTLGSHYRIGPVSTAGIHPMVNAPNISKVSISNTTITGNSAEGIFAPTGDTGCGSVATASSISVCASSLSPQAPAPRLVELVLTHILAADNGGEDVATPAFSLFSLIERPNAAVFPGYGTQFGVDPGLLPLERISNTVSVVPLSIGSAAWNAGWPGFTPPPATDQRGLPRVVDIIDIGAYEVQEAVLVPKFTG